MRDGSELRIDLPPNVAHVLSELTGFDAVLVGGCVRDLVRGEAPTDWDVASAAPPEEVVARFPTASWENRFGTVTVPPGREGEPAVEVTTFRIEGPYRDRRRPASVSWGRSLEDDLARRDFTVNAMAWRPSDVAAGLGVLVDPQRGAADMAAGVLRAVGEPDERIGEDALRMVRAVRFAGRFGMALDPATAAAIRRHAPEAAELSGERLRGELMRILGDAAEPSAAMMLMEELGLLGVVLPELAALRGVPQAKAIPGDALDHSLRTADALPPDDPVLRLAGLLHDIGKATTQADGHFIGHEEAGARQVAELMRRLRFSRAEIARVEHLVRQHMFAYGPEWTDAAVRRFIRRVGPGTLDDLFALRRADNLASGAQEPADGGLDELRRRTATALAGDPLGPRQLAIGGDDLVSELGLAPGPMVGTLLAELLEAVLDDPSLNQRDLLLERARESVEQAPSGDRVHREAPPPLGESD
jgi:tRNA nucleotidyltransferase (CCA-adding enzyme)